MNVDTHAALHTYAGWNTELPERLKCASGGAAFLLGKHYIRDLGGVVYATAFTPEKDFRVIRITTLEALETTKGSKYVRSSFPKETLDQLQADLEAGKLVLFVGTPCQVAGIRGRAGLLCVDLLCHGTPPQSYLQAELKHLVGDRPYTDVRFRGNDGHDFHLSVWDGDRCLYSVEARKQPYLLAMLRGVTLMEGCYNCPFARPERVGDITLGDYIGLGASDGFRADGRNVSYISVNTPEGERAYQAFCRANPTFYSIERPLDERQGYRPSILEPTERHPLRDTFLQALPDKGFARAIRRTMRGEIFRASKLYRTLHHWAHVLLRRK